MDEDDWARSLNACKSGLDFETILETCRENLHHQREHTVDSEDQLPEKDDRDVVGHQDRIFSAGDHRIWHQRVENWVKPSLNEDEDEETSKGMNEVAAKLRVDLVEALFGHGILRDYDLPILSPIDGEDRSNILHSDAPQSDHSSVPRDQYQYGPLEDCLGESIGVLQQSSSEFDDFDISDLLNVESFQHTNHYEDRMSRL
jgi:hypothetical protein